jgi:transposase, IS5 family
MVNMQVKVNDKSLLFLKTLALLPKETMYRSNLKQLEFESFNLPFDGHLRSDNRWVKLAKFIPWEEFEAAYSKTLESTRLGPPAMSVRVALGALIIKERLGTSDEETVEQIRENPYLQYFLGFKDYKDEQPFHPSMFVHFRKRIGKNALSHIVEVVNKKAMTVTTPTKRSGKGDDDDKGCAVGGENPNQGKLILDATCTPADITFPTDLKLLNAAREKSEHIIDVLHEPHKGKKKKPRTYRKAARKAFLSIAKSKKVSKSKLRKAIRKQLGYLGRNLKTIDKLSRISPLLLLDRRDYKLLLVISEVYRQQKWMLDHGANRIDDRIVSIYQPHVRPIKRGKAGAATEFGAKISVSLIDGFSYLDRLSWDNYNESSDLIVQVEAYRKRFGFFPASVHADKIYRNRDNIRFCKKHGIRISGPPLGRPTGQNEKRIEALKQSRQDELDRIPIEGKFGQAKRRFSLSRIMCKLALTSQTAIAVVFLVMNLEKWLQSFLLSLIFVLHSSLKGQTGRFTSTVGTGQLGYFATGLI